MVGGLLATVTKCKALYMPAEVVLAWEPRDGVVKTFTTGSEDAAAEFITTEPAGRFAIDPTYKSGRKGKTPGTYYEAEEEIRTFFGALDVLQVYPAAGWEADDVAATYASQDGPTLLWSSDHDWLQLVSPEVHLHRPDCSVRPRGVPPEEWRRPDGILVTPENIREVKTGGVKGLDAEGWLYYLALAGCKGDGVDGVPGIGATRATALIEACPLVVDLVLSEQEDEAVAEVCETNAQLTRFVAKAAAHREELQRSLDLVRLRVVGLEVVRPDPAAEKVEALRMWLEGMGIWEMGEGLVACDGF